MSLIKSQLINPDYATNNNELRKIKNKVNKNLLKFKQELISVEQTLEPLQFSKFKKLVVDFIIELNIQYTDYREEDIEYDEDIIHNNIVTLISKYNKLSRFIITTFDFNKLSVNNKNFINLKVRGANDINLKALRFIVNFLNETPLNKGYIQPLKDMFNEILIGRYNLVISSLLFKPPSPIRLRRMGPEREPEYFSQDEEEPEEEPEYFSQDEEEPEEEPEIDRRMADILGEYDEEGQNILGEEPAPEEEPEYFNQDEEEDEQQQRQLELLRQYRQRQLELEEQYLNYEPPVRPEDENFELDEDEQRREDEIDEDIRRYRQDLFDRAQQEPQDNYPEYIQQLIQRAQGGEDEQLEEDIEDEFFDANE